MDCSLQPIKVNYDEHIFLHNIITTIYNVPQKIIYPVSRNQQLRLTHRTAKVQIKKSILESHKI